MMKFSVRRVLCIVSVSVYTVFPSNVHISDQLKECFAIICENVDDHEQTFALKATHSCILRDEFIFVPKDIFVSAIEDALALLDKYASYWTTKFNVSVIRNCLMKE